MSNRRPHEPGDEEFSQPTYHGSEQLQTPQHAGDKAKSHDFRNLVGAVLVFSGVGYGAYKIIWDPENSHWKNDSHGSSAPGGIQTDIIANPAPNTGSLSPTPSVSSSPTAIPKQISSSVPESTPPSIPAPPTSPSPASSSVAVGPPISESSEDFKIAQTMIVGFDASTPLQKIEQVVADTHIGGIYLTGTTDAVSQGFDSAYYDKLSQLAGARMLVAGDEEGGYVHREAYNFNFPSAKEMGSMSVGRVERIGKLVGAQMRQDGVMVDLAPVLDIDNGKGDGAISKWDRSFGSNPFVIARKASAFAAGLEQAGVTPVFKHFPGIGRALPDSDTDSHKAVSPPFSSLQKLDLQPYAILMRRGAISAVMMSNEIVSGLDDYNPASTSRTDVSYLRNSLGFNGLISTDSLTVLKHYDGKKIAENIVESVQAGVDAPLFSYTGEAGILNGIQLIKQRVPASKIDASYAKVLALKQAS